MSRKSQNASSGAKAGSQPVVDAPDQPNTDVPDQPNTDVPVQTETADGQRPAETPNPTLPPDPQNPALPPPPPDPPFVQPTEAEIQEKVAAMEAESESAGTVPDQGLPEGFTGIPTPEPAEPRPERAGAWNAQLSVEQLAEASPVQKPKYPAIVEADIIQGQKLKLYWHDKDSGNVVDETMVDEETKIMTPDDYALMLIQNLPEASDREYYERFAERGYTPYIAVMSQLQQGARYDNQNVSALEAQAEDTFQQSQNPNQPTPINNPRMPQPAMNRPGQPNMYSCNFCGEPFAPRKSGQICCDNVCGKLHAGEPVYPDLAKEKQWLHDQRFGVPQLAAPANAGGPHSPQPQPDYQPVQFDPNARYEGDPRHPREQDVIPGPGRPPATQLQVNVSVPADAQGTRAPATGYGPQPTYANSVQDRWNYGRGR